MPTLRDHVGSFSARRFDPDWHGAGCDGMGMLLDLDGAVQPDDEP